MKKVNEELNKLSFDSAKDALRSEYIKSISVKEKENIFDYYD